MTLRKETTVTFEQMKGAVGSLLFLWSQIERELAVALNSLNVACLSKSPHRIARTLDLWSLEIQKRAGQSERAAHLRDRLMTHLREALSIRNLVCHGLIGITAQINPTDEEAHLSVELGGASRRLSWTELQAVFKGMSQARWLIRDLTTAVLELDPRRGDELLSVWDEFPHRR